MARCSVIAPAALMSALMAACLLSADAAAVTRSERESANALRAIAPTRSHAHGSIEVGPVFSDGLVRRCAQPGTAVRPGTTWYDGVHTPCSGCVDGPPSTSVALAVQCAVCLGSLRVV